jgi:hypothetical protein
MTTLSLQASRAAPARSLFGLERVLSVLDGVFAVFAEAQERARVAHERAPFAAW